MMNLYSAMLIISGLTLFIVAFYFYAKARENYINNLESHADVISVLSLTLAAGATILGVLIL